MEDKYTITDLLNASVDQKPHEFQDIFNSILIDRISNAVENKKIEVAHNMFNTDTEEHEE